MTTRCQNDQLFEDYVECLNQFFYICGKRECQFTHDLEKLRTLCKTAAPFKMAALKFERNFYLDEVLTLELELFQLDLHIPYEKNLPECQTKLNEFEDKLEKLRSKVHETLLASL